MTMNLELSPDQRLFAQTTRRFLESEAPIARVRELHEQNLGLDRGFWRKGTELGWTSLLVPEGLGGGTIGDHGLVDLTLVAEEMGRLVSPGPLLSTSVTIDALTRATDTSNHLPIIRELLSGEAIAAWVFDMDATLPRIAQTGLRARPDGDGWLLDGAATVIDAPIADYLLVSAQTSGGVTQFLVPVNTDGVSIDERTSLDLARRVGEVRLHDVSVPASAVVGGVDSARADVEHQLQVALVVQNAETVGALDRAFMLTIAYAGDRVAFGRPISSYQALKHRFADMKLWLEACHATAAASAYAVANGSGRAPELVSVAKSYIADRAPLMVQDCIQIHGGIGVTWEHDMHLYLRRITQNAALFGDVRYHRARVATLLGN